jgi:hypothetical protein
MISRRVQEQVSAFQGKHCWGPGEAPACFGPRGKHRQRIADWFPVYQIRGAQCGNIAEPGVGGVGIVDRAHGKYVRIGKIPGVYGIGVLGSSGELDRIGRAGSIDWIQRGRGDRLIRARQDRSSERKSDRATPPAQRQHRVGTRPDGGTREFASPEPAPLVGCSSCAGRW